MSHAFLPSTVAKLLTVQNSPDFSAFVVLGGDQFFLRKGAHFGRGISLSIAKYREYPA